jgi:RimJ/RimL family protein N-acetyltransferase
LKVVIDRSGAVARWVANRIPLMAGTLGFEEKAVSFGVLSDDGKALGGVVFTDWQPAFQSIQISFASASPRWLTPKLVTAILEYPFGQLGCQMIHSATPSQTASAREFLERFGFRRDGVIRRAFGTDDAVISTLLQEEWAEHRFNRRRRERRLNGQAHSPDPARSAGCLAGADRVQQGHGRVQLAAEQL